MSTRVVRAAALDVVSVVVFVAIGRRSHDEGGNVVVGASKVAAPFLLALVVGWLVAQAWRRPTRLATGAIVWVVTVALGMVLRHWVFDRGTAASFIVVASIVLGAFLLGWRAVESWLTRRAGPAR
jgi:predicted permease